MGLFSMWTGGSGGGPKPSTSQQPRATPPRKHAAPSAPLASTRTRAGLHASGTATPAPTAAEPSRGATVQEAVRTRDIYDQAKGANASSSQAVNLLQQMMEPGPVENKSLEEVKALLTDIVDKLVTLDDRLARMEARSTGPRAVSTR